MPKSQIQAISALPDGVALIIREPPSVEFDETFRRVIGREATLTHLRHNCNEGKIEFWFDYNGPYADRLSENLINRIIDRVGGNSSPAAVATGPVTITGHCAIFNLLQP